MPERAFPPSPKATPEVNPTSSNLLPSRFMNRKFATVSLATNRSIQPSLLMSVATTPHDFPGLSAIPIFWLTSVNVPSPLLWKSQLAIGV